MLKRDLILFRRGLLPALVLLVLLLGACFFAGFAAKEAAGSALAAAKLAVCDGEDSILSRMCIKLVSEQDFVSSLLEIEKADEAEALEGIADGTYAAAIVLPENFTESIMHGEEQLCSVYVSDAAAASADLIKEVCKFGGLMIAAGQFGVFSGEQLFYSGEVSWDAYDSFLLKSNNNLLHAALSVSDEAFNIVSLPYRDGLSLAGYYFCCWLALILLICPLFFERLYKADKNTGMQGRLKGEGISFAQYYAGKFIYPFIFNLAVAFATCIAAARLSLCSVSVPGIILGAALSVIIVLIPVLLFEKYNNAVLFVLVILSISLLLCGGVIPFSMLPDWMNRLSAFTPVGIVFKLLCI